MNVTSDKSGNSSSSHDDNDLSNDAQKGNSDSNDDGISNELNDMSIGSSSKKKKKNTCLCCLKEVDGLLGCSRCLTARYCDKKCQVKHWPAHKNSCRDSNDTEDSNVKLHTKAYNHREQGNFTNR
jgi:hypothetical protein